ncbi:hypothetical protein [Funiculus sociatus]
MRSQGFEGFVTHFDRVGDRDRYIPNKKPPTLGGFYHACFW